MEYHLRDATEYITQRYDFLVWAEETGNVKTTLYRDSKGFPTIGAGFKVTSNLEEILKAFGFVWNALPGTAEYNYIQQIKAKFYTDTAMTKEKTFTVADIATLQSELDAIMAERAGSHTTFAFTDTNEIKATFVPIAQKREDILDAWLAKKGLTIPDSNERITLLSLVYNNVIGFSDAAQTKPKCPSLLNALAAGNRAEAWFEIRYNSNGDKSNGIAKRRYYEADYFDLYEAGTLTDEEKVLQAKTIFRMYTRHKDKITEYDTKYGAQVAKANSDYQVSWVKSTADNLKGAKDYLIANFADGKTINGEIVVGAGLPTYTYLEGSSGLDGNLQGTELNDLIFGERGTNIIYGKGGNDVIYGGDGVDKIEGGTGDDLIFGGDGHDVYIINTGDGLDKIEDKQGDNRVIINGKVVGDLYKQSDGTRKSADGDFVGVYQGTDFLITQQSTGTSVILNENFESGDFGINLLDAPVEPVTNNTIIDEEVGTLYDTAANDLIIGSSEDDGIIGGWRGGNDWIRGGGGSDAISTGSGIVEGNADSDIIMGGSDGSKLFGENYGEMETLIADGEVAPSIGVKGDLVSGNHGNDFISGSDANDALFGGEGHDLIVGGGGNDALFGDDACSGAERDWSFEIAQNSVTFSGTFYFRPTTFQGNDVIYAGTGNDIVYAGGGSDEIDAGSGNDTVAGEGGSDVIFGGEGDDILDGDGDWIALNEQGDDYIDGGAGDDTIWGYHGSDTLFGGDGNDEISGSEDDDYLDGEAGVDTLYGGEGNDTLFGGADNDLLQGDNGDDYLDGEAGDDTIAGVAGSDTIFGGDGNDRLHGDSGDTALADQGNDYIDGEAGDDYIVGYAGDDELYGGDGNDTIYGGAGADLLYGGEGINRMEGGDGNDYIEGGADADTILGEAGDDQIVGGEGNNWLQGDDGNDYLEAGAGDDMIIGGAGMDQLFGGDGVNWLQGEDGDDYLEGGVNNDTILGGAGNDQIWGGDGANKLQGDEGDDILTGGSGADEMLGGSGSDELYGGDGDDLMWGETAAADANYGNDHLYGGNGNDILDGGEGNDYLDGGAGDDLIIGGAGADYIVGGDGTNELQGNDGDDHIEGGAGSDTMYGDSGADYIDGGEGVNQISAGEGNDYITAGSGADTIWGESGDDQIFGGDGDNWLHGDDGSDNITAGSGNDTIFGGTGNDSLSGGAGSDYYIFNRGDGQDTINNYDTSAGVDVIQLSADIQTSNVSVVRSGSDLVLKINGTTDQITVQNFFLSDEYKIDFVLFASGIYWDTATLMDKAQYINGTDAAERIEGFETNDVIHGFGGSDEIYGGAGNDLLYGGLGDDSLYGQSGADILDGNSGNDFLSGDAGDDTYTFGLGYGQDTILESDLAPGNTDAVQMTSDISQSDILAKRTDNNLVINLRDTVDQLTIQDFFLGDANKVEQMKFGDGTILQLNTTSATNDSDLLIGTNAADMINGSGGNDVVFGNDGNDTIDGGDGNDVLDGGLGADTLYGGSGDDVYVVDDAGDVITEAAGAGSDTVKSSVTYTLGANVECLILTGTSAINGTGNAVENILFGNSGANTLNGGSGADSMYGGVGNDTYIIDHAADRAVENYDEGIDTIYSSVTYSLEPMLLQAMNLDVSPAIVLQPASNIENLILTGTAAINGTGDALNNTLVGNSASNTLTGGAGDDMLDGGVGADKMLGGSGNDTYVVDNRKDIITENAGEGTDTVQSKITYTLGANLENLTLTGTSAINGTGNTLNNTLVGNSAANTLTGNAGADTLDGGAGRDTLSGGVGNDTYIFNRGYGVDTISDYDTTAGNKDIAQLGVSSLELIFTRSSSNLNVSINGSTDQLTVQNWYKKPAYQVEVLKSSDGKQLLNSQVDQLIQAMATFCSSNGITWSQAIQQKPTEVEQVLAQYWGPVPV